MKHKNLIGMLVAFAATAVLSGQAPASTLAMLGVDTWAEAVLLWALGRIQELPDSATQCDTGVFKSVLPPFATTSTQAFIAQATLIDADRLWLQADLYLEVHWKARDARLHERPMPPGIDIEIVQERHHAINWITGYDGLPWDEVTTDT